jgi:hypothetical protein
MKFLNDRVFGLEETVHTSFGAHSHKFLCDVRFFHTKFAVSLHKNFNTGSVSKQKRFQTQESEEC